MSISESAVIITQMLNGNFNNVKDGTSLNISGMNKGQFQQVLDAALSQKRMLDMLTRIRLLKIVLGFLLLALIGNLGIPWMANHGNFDISNQDFYPYLILSFSLFVTSVFFVILIIKRPLPNHGLYAFAKVMLPIAAIILAINAYRTYKGMIWGWGMTSALLFIIQISIVMATLYLSFCFLKNKRIDDVNETLG